MMSLSIKKKYLKAYNKWVCARILKNDEQISVASLYTAISIVDVENSYKDMTSQKMNKIILQKI